jgi:hypothetical protein
MFQNKAIRGMFGHEGEYSYRGTQNSKDDRLNHSCHTRLNSKMEFRHNKLTYSQSLSYKNYIGLSK